MSRSLQRVVAQQEPFPFLEVPKKSCISIAVHVPTPILTQVPVQGIERIQHLEDGIEDVAAKEAHGHHGHKVLDCVREVGVAFPGGK